MAVAWVPLTLLTTILYFQGSTGSSCPDDWVDCGNEVCVAYLWRCDGDNDCGNMKDEEDCESGIPPRACMDLEFQCVKDGSCIPSSWHCDGQHDCLDESDEMNCENDTSCHGFRCKDNHCIPSKWKCDGRKDCPDNSDEDSCPRPAAKVCTDTEFTCSSGSCLDLKRVCDGKKDCPDASDEGRHCSDVCTNATCSQRCRPSPKGPDCYCHDGFVLSTRDNKTCSDIDECAEDGFCSQQCINLLGSYKCSCLDGYDLIDRTCKASGTEPLLIFSTLQEIRGVYLRSKKYFPVRKAVFKAAAVDADPLSSRIYWVEISNKSAVYSSKMDGLGFELVLHNGLMIPEDIAVDYVARNLYFTDSGLKQILVCKMDGSMCHVLHSSNLEKPRAITLDPPEGLVYWSDWGENASGIYRSGMDGSRRIALVSKDIKWPNGIAIDHTTNRLYWTDAKLLTIEYISLDGTNRKVLLEDETFHPYSLAVFEDNLYWSDWNSFSLDTCNKFTGHRMNVMTRENGKHIMGVHVYHPVLARTTGNPCWDNPCSHMCLIAPLGGYRCACPPGFSLGSDGRRCLVDSNFPMLWVSDESKIYHVRPETVGSMLVDELPVAHIEKIGRLAYDWRSKALFVTDLQKPAIYAINMTTFVRRELVRNHIVMPEDIALDWINRNLYWVDSSKGTVEVVSTESAKTATIVVDLSKPTALALLPSIGRMFISTTGEIPSVAMYDMNGKNRVPLKGVTGYVTALAVHPTLSLLYFINPKEESLLSLDYSDPQSQPTHLKTRLGSVTSVAADDKYIYWTDSKNHALNYVRQNNSFTHSISLPGLHAGFTSRRVIYAAEPTRMPRGHDGCVGNGRCSYLCLSAPGGPSCICPIGMQLGNDSHTCIDKECTHDEFQCVKSKKCVPHEFVCDGVNDCSDGSDESCSDVFAASISEKVTRCPGDDFRCLNGRCIMASWKCDRRDDCGDGSDEVGCPLPTSCTKDQYMCADAECIPMLWRCDGESDCNDSSDEAHCNTTSCDPEMQLRCDHGQCIPKSWTCDGASDCFDGTDERNCTTTKTCSFKEFKCDDETCIDKTLVCDQRSDCEDGSDEKNCTKETCKEGRHQCADGATCIYIHEVCDQNKDCPDGDDEVNCTRVAEQCSSEEYFCTNNSRCISKTWICDGDNDCGDAADEIPENCTKRVTPTLPPYTKYLECEEFFCDISGECISWSKVCDGENDCKDLTDEGALCSRACAHDHGGCSQVCQKTPQGSKCSCYNGYSLSEDLVTCEDVNECDIPGSCSQFCNNTKGGFKCYCTEGYFLEHHKKCKADGGPATLVYLLPDQIRGIELNTHSQRVYVSGSMTDMRGMDYDAAEGLFFWSDWKEGTINSYNPNNNRQDVLVTILERPHFLRWDWIAKNIYFTDDEGSIKVCNSKGQYCATLVPQAASHINGIDISPSKGLMFWCVWGMVLHEKYGKIERAELDGSRRMVIVNDRMVWPNAVTVDHVMEMVYWTDSRLNVMECTDFHGLKRRTVVPDGMYYPFSMVMFEDFVYWSDWGTDTIIRCDKYGGNNCIQLHRTNVKSEVIMIVHKVKQPKGENRCLNSGCPQLCLPTRTSFTCKCGDNYYLANGTCEVKPTSSPVKPLLCPTDYCSENAIKCVVLGKRFLCRCPKDYEGEKCDVKVSDVSSPYDYSWVVGVVLAVLFVGLIAAITVVCRQNREKLSRVSESVAVSFRNNGFGRKSGQLVVDTDDGSACDELMLGDKDSSPPKKQSSGFGNPLFGKKPRLITDPESQDGDFKRWPSYDSGDSAFVSECPTREGSQLCIDEAPLSGAKPTDRLVQFFRR